MEKRQKVLYLIITLGCLGICLTISFIILSLDSPLNQVISLPGNQPPLQIYIQSPPPSEVGKETQMILIAENRGSEPIKIEEILLPKELLEVAVVMEIDPGSLSQNHYEGYTGFQIGQSIAPDRRETFKITLLPKDSVFLTRDVQVIANSITIATAALWKFTQPVAIVPATNTSTPTFAPTFTFTPIPATLTPTPRLPIPYKSVVKLIAKYKHSSYLRTLWTGSGTIISPDGLILTNAHLVLPTPFGSADAFIIAMTHEPDREPVNTFIAEVIEADENLDLALMRITMDIKYKEVDPDTLFLPAIPLADSDQVELGDPIIILGYPGIGGDTITLTRGKVGGFTSQDELGKRSFIKTSGGITGGTSGGMVIDQLGRLIGIPSQLGSGSDDRDKLVDCQIIADTNDDGIVNSQDQCMPTGGFINAIRPINLAIPMIKKYMDPKFLHLLPNSESD